jgi:hypothetical protein
MKTAPLDRPSRPESGNGSLRTRKAHVQDHYSVASGDDREKGDLVPGGLNLPARRIAILVATLFLVQMITAMIGSALVDAFVAGDAGRTTMTIGVLLAISAGVVVVGIGFLMYPVLKLVNKRLAAWYPAFRLLELTVATVGGIYLLAQLQEVPNYFLWLYIPTGIGGLIFTYLLFVSRLVPRPIGALGLVGYALLLLGVPLDLLGLLDMNSGPGLMLLVPGGLFEVVFLPIWLFAKGFRLPAAGATNRW